jgi:hypothetical protein
MQINRCPKGKFAGIPEKVSVRKPRSRRPWDTISVDSEWAITLGSHIPVYDDWPRLESQYKTWLRECDEWRAKLDAEVRAQKQAKEAHEKEIEREVVRREMVARHGLPEVTTLHDVRWVLLNKNKYLRLAHFLEANRGDWSEGCDYAETGLNGFTVETDEDREIQKEISALCSDWDGDGRCFRDCKWNYGALYQKVPPELLADYQKVAGLIA